MFEDHRIIVVTPAGRRQYLELLIPQILAYHSAGIVDEYHLWVNTSNEQDIAYMQSMQATLPHLIKLRYLPPNIKSDGNRTIRHFFKECTAPKTTYVRFDDDIILLDTPEQFKAFLHFRISHPEYFVVYANIINNAIILHILQRFRKIDISHHGIVSYNCFDHNGWNNGAFTANVHDQVLQAIKHHPDDPLQQFRFKGEWILYYFEYVSINCISWLGDNFKAQCDGIIAENEELDISVLKPRQLGMSNTIYGDYCCVHYAFFTQRDYLDSNNYYDNYKDAILHATKS